jgi:hypothetical protein
VPVPPSLPSPSPSLPLFPIRGTHR